MISFVDANGDRGEITEEFRTRYDGKWSEDVEEYLDELQREVADGEVDERRRAFDRVILDLPERTRVVEVERRRSRN